VSSQLGAKESALTANTDPRFNLILFLFHYPNTALQSFRPHQTRARVRYNDKPFNSVANGGRCAPRTQRVSSCRME
jgi:hypothetical protein